MYIVQLRNEAHRAVKTEIVIVKSDTEKAEFSYYLLYCVTAAATDGANGLVEKSKNSKAISVLMTVHYTLYTVHCKFQTIAT